MCMPAVKQLRRFLPQGCGLFVACPESLAPVWAAAPWVDVVGPFCPPRLRGEDLRRLRGLGAGVGIVLPNSFGSAWDLWRAGLALRLGRAGNGRRLLLTHALRPWRKSACRGCHQLSHYLEIAAAFGAVEPGDIAAELEVEHASETAARFGVRRVPGVPWLALAPGAAYGPAKQWSAEAFGRVAREWTRRGGRVVAVGTARERSLGDVAIAGSLGALNLAGTTSLGELMAVLSVVRAVAANDSGAMHLAAALGTPGVAVFGSTDPTATGPLGERWIVLREEFPCAPCFRRTCPLPEADYRCLRTIAPERVMTALERIGACGGAGGS
ncbi:MAG: lipopolysaccharide heptosyltransferase II [Kiritimatiellaeota bacterium]|nr:lipopolysaccharide heptosyltransferase II [Kiritimatiellota bacterium]